MPILRAPSLISMAMFACIPTFGCVGLQSPRSSPGGHPMPAAYFDSIRASEAESAARDWDSVDKSLDKDEAEALKAIRATLGKANGGEGSTTASVAIKELRTAQITLRIEPSASSDGPAKDPDALGLHDSFTERAQNLSRKVSEKTATPAERKGLQSGSKYMMKITDLKM